ncbi:MAG: chloride channel protein [Chthoniobacterales bacterium]
MKAVVLALIGAICAGLGALYFEWVEGLSEQVTGKVWETSRFWMFLIMPLGLGVILFLRDRFFVGSDGTGIPQTMAALKLGPGEERDRLLSMRIAVGKILLTTLGLFSGLSIGREGPSVQVGACFMHLVTRWAEFPAHLAQRGLILAGGAAGIAAAFNAPLAGIVFSFEEIGRSFEKENLGTLVRTVAIACLVCMIPFGDYFFYGRIDFGRTLPLEFLSVGPWVAVIGIAVVGGALGGAFSKLLLWVMPMVSAVIRRRFWVIALAFGLGSAGLAVLSDGLTLGSGYREAQAMVLDGSEGYLQTLSEDEREEIAATRAEIGPMYPVYRAAASMMALLTGIPGGLFDPSFSVGAGLGKIAAPWLAWTGAPVQGVVLLFIVAYFSGVVQSPLTSVVILVEMTGAVAFTLPLGIAAILAFEVSRRICPVALYEALAENFMRRTE